MSILSLVTDKQETVDPRRTVAALAIRGLTLAGVATTIGRTRHHLHEQVQGKRPLSVRSREALQTALGPEGWAYATGKTDLLPPPQAQGAARAA